MGSMTQVMSASTTPAPGTSSVAERAAAASIRYTQDTLISHHQPTQTSAHRCCQP
jgi:hypothetical protein